MKFIIVLLSLVLICSETYAQSNLPDFLNLAYSNSPLINDNKNQQITNQAEADRLRAMTTKLQLSIGANYLFAPVFVTDAGHKGFQLNSTGATNYYGFDLGTTNGGSIQGMLIANQPLFATKRAAILAEQANVASQINKNIIKLTRHDLEKAVTDQYILCLLDQKQIANASENMDIIDQQREVVKKLVNASLLKNSDLILLNIEYDNNKNILLTYQAAYHKDLLELRIVSGSKNINPVKLDSIELKLTGPPQQSAYLEKFRLDSINAVAIQNAFEIKYKPQLSLFGNAGLNGTHFSTLLPYRFGVSGGLNLSWTILDGKQKDITRRKTQIQLQTVAFNKDIAEFQNSQRKKQVLDELSSYDARLQYQRQQLNNYQLLLGAYRTQVIQAQLSVIDFINVLKNRTIAQRDLVQLETNRNLLINAYNYWNW